MRQPKVSIIVPNYNYERYLNGRLDSILQQTLQDFELILADDCSTDNSRDVLARYAENDSRVSHFLVNRQNSGSPFAQWAKGLALAKGKYIWIAEADDEADPRFLERLTGWLDCHPQASVAASASRLMDEQGKILPGDYDRWHKRKYINGRQATLYPGEAFVVHNMYWRNRIYNASGVVFRKDAVSDRVVNALSMRYCADWLFWSELIAPACFIEVHDRLNRFRIHSTSVTRRADHPGSIEAVDIISSFNTRFDIPACKRLIRAGRFYRRTDKLPLTRGKRLDIYRHIQTAFGVKRTAALALSKLADVCPFMPNEAHDHIKGTPLTSQKHP